MINIERIIKIEWQRQIPFSDEQFTFPRRDLSIWAQWNIFPIKGLDMTVVFFCWPNKQKTNTCIHCRINLTEVEWWQFVFMIILRTHSIGSHPLLPHYYRQFSDQLRNNKFRKQDFHPRYLQSCLCFSFAVWKMRKIEMKSRWNKLSPSKKNEGEDTNQRQYDHKGYTGICEDI